MSDEPNRWQQQNDEYLSRALAWLRLRLAWVAGLMDQDPVEEARGLFRRRSAPTSASADEAEVAQAAAALAEFEAAEHPPALLILSQQFGLSPFERDVLLLCVGLELDTRVAGLCARAQDDPGRAFPTFALALSLFEDPAWDALSPKCPLRYWRLIEISQPNNQPLTTSPLRADERIVNYVKGLNTLDSRLSPLLVPFDAEGDRAELAPSQWRSAQAIVSHVENVTSTGPPPFIQLVGPDSLSKQLVAGHAAMSLGLDLYRMPAELLPERPAELETLVRLWQRESILMPVALYLDAQEADGEASREEDRRGEPPIHRFLSRNPGLVFLSTREVRPRLGRSHLPIDVDKPTVAEQRAAWAGVLSLAADDTPAQLAGQFNLNLVTIHQIGEAALAAPVGEGQSLDDRLWGACLAHTRPRMDQLAQRIDPKATWGDIVLPEEQSTLLHQIADQVGRRVRVYDEWGFRQKMNRGLGISALFAGESGTGKTMAAEVMANDLRLNLYRIDLSTVVSKYVGETEKNLRRLFDAAEDGGAILFFDEADALFGKRSEVKDSHDRYANIEISYLLQRMEAYRGLAILATNMKSALDQAFMRRLRFVIDFPFPGPADRRRIWEMIFPAETPVEGLDYAWLSRLNLTGGSIHNIALNAAFLAARRGTPVTMPLVLEAARTEFLKLERPVNEADFRWQAPDAIT
ncbi:MAG: ATP-binding protein [Anaerolineae bacterium]|jgi:hypothetical protein